MSSVLDHDRATAPAAAMRDQAPLRRVTYVAAALANTGLLWVSHQLLDWGWPAFLTGEFEGMLPLVTASLLANLLVDLALIVHDRGRFRVLTELLTTGFGLAVALRLLEVFPFDFSGYATDWTGVTRGLLIALIAVTGVAMVGLLVRFLVGPDEA